MIRGERTSIQTTKLTHYNIDYRNHWIRDKIKIRIVIKSKINVGFTIVISSLFPLRKQSRLRLRLQLQ